MEKVWKLLLKKNKKVHFDISNQTNHCSITESKYLISILWKISDKRCASVLHKKRGLAAPYASVLHHQEDASSQGRKHTATQDAALSKKLPYKRKRDHEIPESKFLKPGLIQYGMLWAKQPYWCQRWQWWKRPCVCLPSGWLYPMGTSGKLAGILPSSANRASATACVSGGYAKSNRITNGERR